MDVDRWLSVLSDIQTGRVELIARDTREPSPFSHEILNANPYAFLDGAPLGRAPRQGGHIAAGSVVRIGQRSGPPRSGSHRHSAGRSWPLVRDADELHDALHSMCLLRADEAPEWTPQFEELVAKSRAMRVDASHASAAAPKFWTVSERWPLVKSLYPEATAEPQVTLPDTVRQNWESAEAMVTLMRGRMQVSGPVTAEQLAEKLALKPAQVFAGLEAIEAEGTVMRGHFTPAEDGNGKAENGQASIEWCERRLLARIHRRTLDGLRRQIQPAEPADFIRFLLRWHHLLPGRQWHGRAGLRKTLAQLQGFEMAAGLWERRILPARCDEYESRWLDEISMSGELAWGRLCPPRKDADDGPSAAGLTRAAPIALLLRENLGWLLPRDRASAEAHCRAGAAAVLETLRQRGALFQHEIMSLTGLLPAQLDEALHELAALGLATADAFTAVRTISGTATERRRAEKRRRQRRLRREFTVAPSGRWSLFPGIVPKVDEEQAAISWAWQLLRRWGVVFRDLLRANPQRRRGAGWCKSIAAWKPAAKSVAADSCAAWRANNTPCRKPWNCCAACVMKGPTMPPSC